MKRRISAALLSLCLLMSLMPTMAFAAPSGSFDDVDGHWGQAAVERWAGYGVVNGDGSGNFNPDNQMTRAEFATMLANMLGYKEKAANTFADVNEDDWFADAILKLAAAGVMQGSNGMANPNAPITRQEAAVLMCRAFNIPTTGGNLDFADSADVADWAKGAVAALADRGMMNGVGNNNVAPLADINRASVATLLDNMITEYVTEDKTITGEVSGIVLVAADATVTVEDATLNENLIVAPKADGAEVTLTGTTTASDVVVGAAATVKVDSNATAGEVVVGAANSTVEVAGKADAVTVDTAANNTAVNVNEGAAVGDVAVNAPDTTVNVGKDATVTNVAVSGSNAAVTVDGKVDNVTVASGATGTGITANSGATVGKVETSANDVTVSGSGKVENVTANDGTVSVTTPGTSVENKTDSADNVTNNGKPVEPSTGGETPTPPSSGGSSSGGTTTPAKKYNVSIPSFTGGKVTADVTATDEHGKTITLTVTPNPQSGNTMPYVLKTDSLKVKNGETDVAVSGSGTTYTFTTPAAPDEGEADPSITYTVEAQFVQPLSEATVLLVDGSSVKINDMCAIGHYPENSDSNPVTDTKMVAAKATYLYIGANWSEGYTKKDITPTVTFNGKSIADPNTKFQNYSCAYVSNSVVSDDSPENQACKYGFTGDFATIKVTFTIDGAVYEFTKEYENPGKAEGAKKVSVIVKDAAGKTIDTLASSTGGTYTLPANTSLDGYYTTGKWFIGDVTTATEVTGEQTIAANYGGTTLEVRAEGIEIKTQTIDVRPAGPAGTLPSFSYSGEYYKAGMDLSGNTITINGDTLVKYLANSDNATTKDYLEQDVGGQKYVYFGVKVGKVDGATQVTEATKTPDFSGKSAISLETDSISGDGTDVLGNELIKYFPMAKDTTPVEFIGKNGKVKAWDRYYLWTDNDGKIKGVTHLELYLDTQIPTYTVTFKDGETTVDTQSVAYGEKATAPNNITKDGYTFAGWYTTNSGAETQFTVDSTPITGPITLTAKWTEVESSPTDVE